MSDPKVQFSLIYDQYIDKIYRFVYLKVNSQDVAEDITSKVFLKAYEAYIKPNNKIDNINAFLYRVASNSVIDHYRERGRANVVSSEAVPETADLGSNVHEKAVFNADIAMIKGAIQKLSKENQEAIIWYYLEDMPIKNIAELLGKPEGTVRVMIHRGLKSLRDIIQES
jgi:RNA polymerase sigma-70 factor (ECF subfamily)